MKEVTRIHLAKTAYDIEVAAKKQLEKYVKSLELYTQDEDVLLDIEIRMTEILSERSVKPGGVISVDDVEAIRAQLGEPHEFADESGDIAVGSGVVGESLENRRYYRDLDGAVLGGVLSGVATYFGFNPLWARLGFILLAIASWGAALLLYVVLWIAVPPARTAAERLQLTGKPVNLAAIRELSEVQVAGENKTARYVRTSLRIFFGISSIGAAILAFTLTLWGGIGLYVGTPEVSPFGEWVSGNEPTAWAVYILSILSGLLLTMLFSVLAYAILRRVWTKKITFTLIGVVVAGILTSTGAVTTGLMHSWQEQSRMMESIKESKAELPKEFAGIKKLTVFTGAVPQSYGDSTDVMLKYIVDEGVPRYIINAPAGIKPDVQINGEEARISVRVPQNIRYSAVPEVTIYGPALSELETGRGSVSYYTMSQDSLKISSLLSGVEIYGEYEKVESVGTGDIRLNEATIEDLIINSKPAGFVTVGVVRSLDVTQPDVCPSSAGDWQSRISVISVSSGVMKYNGKKGAVETRKNHCSLFVVGSESIYDVHERGY